MGRGAERAREAGDNPRPGSRDESSTRAADVGRAAVIGFGSVAAGVVIALLWLLLLGGRAVGSLGSDGSGGHDARGIATALAWLAVPCALACWALAWLSLRHSRGVRFDGRMLSLVLWTMLSPAIWGLGAAAWLAPSGDVGGAALFGWMAAGAGTGLWCVTLTPVWVALLGRRYLRHHPATRPGDSTPAVTGPAELEEDAEVDGARVHRDA